MNEETAKTPLDHVRDTVAQLKEMRHYSKNNVELLTTQWLKFDGELKKLGEYLGRSSIRRVRKQEGLYPDPHRRAHRVPDSPWRKFIELHMN